MSKPPPKIVMFLIDSNDHSRPLYKGEFENCGYDVLAFPTGIQAQKSMQSKIPDLIFIDAARDHQRSIELYKSVRSDTRLSNTIIFIYISLPLRLEYKSCLKDPKLKLIPKPLATIDITRAVSSRLSFLNKSFDVSEDVLTILENTVNQICSFYIAKPLKTKKLKQSTKSSIYSGYSSILVISGKSYIGSIITNYSESFLLEAAESMLGLKASEVDEDTKLSIASELCNQTTGMLQGEFQEKGVRFDLTTPQTFNGSGIIIPHPGSNHIAKVSFEVRDESILGKLQILKGLKNNVEICIDKVS